MPVLETKGAASAQGFGLTLQQTAANYIEDVFSTYLYTGNGSTQTITNGIDLAGEGGLVLTKARSAADGNVFIDTVQGDTKYLTSVNTNSAANSDGTTQNITAFNSNGYALGTNESGATTLNTNAVTYASWTFREQPKFFDVVTYTGNGSTQNISHNLGSVPGCMIVKRTDTTGTWAVYHRSLATNERLILESTAATDTSATTWNNTAPTSTVFSVGFNTATNASGGTYVAYLFAHDAGGFGLSGTDNVISCGSLTADGSGAATVNLGYEAQWVLFKRTDNTQDWTMLDVMRGMSLGQFAVLNPNTSAAEGNFALANIAFPTSTGFGFGAGALANSGQYIYIAIRRGPMEVPTLGTSVYTPVARTGTNSVAVVDAGFPPDLFIDLNRDHLYFANNPWFDRLRGLFYSNSNSTADEFDGSPFLTAYGQTGVTLTNSGLNSNATTYITYSMRRAPGFFDEVCYTGNGPGTQVINHNLTVVPELVINKVRNTTGGWTVFQGSTTALTGFLRLNETSAKGGDTLNVSSTTITVDSTIGFGMNTSGYRYVTYLFATCPGVSKVGSFTGTGATQTINCGFTAGARFVLIKATSTTGNWYVWDSARGIVAGNDPYLELNTINAEVTSTDWVDTAASGFELSNAGGNLANSNGVTYIFLAIA